MRANECASLDEQQSTGSVRGIWREVRRFLIRDSKKSAANKGKKFPPEILRRAEVLALVDACSRSCPTGLRNRALLMTLYRGGLRLNEALHLFVKDLDLDRQQVRVLFGKGAAGTGRRARTVGLDRPALDPLAAWIARRERLPIDQELSPLFCTLVGRPLSGSYVRALVKRLALTAGITKRVHPHGLRHTCAFELAFEGVPVHLIQKHLGHSNVATTSRYLDHVAPQEVIAMTHRRPWSEG